MKNIICIILICSVALFLVDKDIVCNQTKQWFIYTEFNERADYIPSGWMGDYGDIKYQKKHTDNPHAGTSCIKITYIAEGKQSAGWAGIYWQYPANNWGELPGRDLTGVKKLTFWVRGEKGGEILDTVKVGGITGDHTDTADINIGPIELTTDWKQYTIDLEGEDMSNIIGGFCWVITSADMPAGAVFYLDDIVYE